MTLGEILVAPLSKGDFALAQRYRRVFRGQGITVLPFIEQAAEAFARIRIGGAVKPPDAIQLGPRRPRDAICSLPTTMGFRGQPSPEFTLLHRLKKRRSKQSAPCLFLLTCELWSGKSYLEDCNAHSVDGSVLFAGIGFDDGGGAGGQHSKRAGARDDCHSGGSIRFAIEHY